MVVLVSGATIPAMAHGGFRGGFFHGNGFRDGGYRGFGFHHFYYPHLWGGFYIGPQWYWGPTVVIQDIPYYYYNGEYYTPEGDELVAVAPPVSSAATAPMPTAPVQASPAQKPQSVTPAASSKEAPVTQMSGDTIVVNVPNTGGGFTPVKLVKFDKGYIGPQGEYYPDHPKVAELKVLYGK